MPGPSTHVMNREILELRFGEIVQSLFYLLIIKPSIYSLSVRVKLGELVRFYATDFMRSSFVLTEFFSFNFESLDVITCVYCVPLAR